jgi:hypothetical protein
MSKPQTSHLVKLEQPDNPPHVGKATLVFQRPPFLPGSTSNEQLLKAVKAAALGVRDEHVAQMLGVPLQALEYWTKTKEWKSLRATIADQVKEMVAHQVHDMAMKALRELNDRLDYGNKARRIDKKKNDDGATEFEEVEYRVPLSATELTAIANTLFDRADRLDRVAKGQDTPEMEAVRMLADKLAHMDAREINGEVATEADPLDPAPIDATYADPIKTTVVPE